MRNLDYRTKLVIVLLYSGILIGKASTYFGIALGVTFLFEDKMFWRRWYDALTRPGDPAGSFSWALLVSVLYGVAQVIRGCFLEYPLTTALEILVFNLCPIYLFSGIWAGARAPWIVPQYIRIMAWYAVIYTILYALVFRHFTISLSGVLPGSGMDLFGRPRSGSLVLLGLLAYAPSLARFWLPVIVLCCLTIANQERGDWLGFMVALTVWGWLARRINRVMIIGAAVASILLVAYLVDLRLPGFEDRGGELSASDTVARMAGMISPELAEEAGASVANSEYYYGTVYWRKHWWAQISDEVSANFGTRMFGLGYGYPLASLAGSEVEAQGTRSPHNIFYFAYGYSGLVGVAIFAWLQLSLLRLLWRAFKVTGETFGLVFFSYALIGAFFGNFLETPQAGIYVYIFLGLLLGPSLSPISVQYAFTTPTFNEMVNRSANAHEVPGGVGGAGQAKEIPIQGTSC
jgi:hypothetical protein